MHGAPVGLERCGKADRQAHQRVGLPEQIDPIDKDRRRSAEPQRLGVGVGVNPSEPNIDCGSTDGVEGMPQPLPYDRQAGAALDEPDFNVHPSILRQLAACRCGSGRRLVVGTFGPPQQTPPSASSSSRCSGLVPKVSESDSTV